MPSLLERHMRTHTHERPHQCRLCGRSYSQSGNLNVHLKTVHGVTVDGGRSRADPEATRHTMSGMLAWDKPLAEPFRELLWHPKLVPVLQTILGDGYRLDNGPLVMSMAPGGGGQNLHGGGFERDLAESYDYRNGRFYTGMCVLEVLLADQPAGAGGLCVVPGSRAPTAFRRILRSA